MVYITCDVQDKNGTLCPNADNSVTFAVVGGTIIGTDNGHGANVEKLSGSTHAAFSGKCLCVVKHDGASGAMKITATASGLTTGTISVTKGDIDGQGFHACRVVHRRDESADAAT